MSAATLEGAMDLPDVSELDLRTKVGQLFVAGFDGHEPTPEIEDLIADRGLGNVIYFARNLDSPAQTARLSRELQRLAGERDPGIPLLVAVDQEGGVVSRLSWSEPPGHMAIGATGDPGLARRAGGAIAAELDALGINFDLAPVLDVNSNPENPVIGVRSFGGAPDLVGELGSAFAAGMQAEGVLACGKHFPGHGDTGADSHHELPVVTHDRERLDRVEFAPFRSAVESGIDAIMTAHVSLPAITDEEGLPATIAPAVQTGLLREHLGFEGLVLTDCLEMSAIADGVGIEEGAIRAIEAGCDLVLVSHTPERQAAAIDAVRGAVEGGRIPEERVDRSVRRVLDAKAERAVGTREPSTKRWEATRDRARETARRVAKSGVTVVRDDGSLPLEVSEDLHLLGCRPGATSPAEDDRYDPDRVADALCDAGFDVHLHRIEDAGGPPRLSTDTQVVIAVYDASSNAWQAEVVHRLVDRDIDPVVLAVRNPYDLSRFPGVGTFLTTYDYTPTNLAVAGEVLAGDHEARGTLPVAIPGVDR